jgi:hypothetical protein
VTLGKQPALEDAAEETGSAGDENMGHISFVADWKRKTMRITIMGSSGCRKRACTVMK